MNYKIRTLKQVTLIVYTKGDQHERVREPCNKIMPRAKNINKYILYT